MTEHDPFDTSAPERHAADRMKADKLVSLTEAEDWKWFMSGKRGRRIVHRLLETTGVYRSSFTGNSTTFFNEGQRNVGLRVLALVHEHAPEQYAAMIAENK